MVTRFQQAVLQEMGITLWREQSGEVPSAENAQSVASPPAPVPSTKRSENSSNHLAALRQSLSPKSKDELSTPLQRDLSHHEAQLTIVSDIRYAATLCGLSQSIAVQIGSAMAVTASQIMLPVPPDKLTTTQKRELWQAMIAQAAQ